MSDNAIRVHTPNGLMEAQGNREGILKVAGGDKKQGTSITANATTSSTLVVNPNESRQYLVLINSSDTDIWLAEGVAAVANYGIYLVAHGGAYEWAQIYGNLTGVGIYAIHAGSGNKVLSGIEK